MVTLRYLMIQHLETSLLNHDFSFFDFPTKDANHDRKRKRTDENNDVADGVSMRFADASNQESNKKGAGGEGSHPPLAVAFVS